MILATIGLWAVVGNVLILLALVGLRRMRRCGHNLMLANVAIADLLMVLTAVPTSIINHVSRPQSHLDHYQSSSSPVGPLACRFVHYVIFVAVYVTAYTLVVVCVFGFFGELMRGGGGGRNGNGNKSSGTGNSGSVGGGRHQQQQQQHQVPLSTCSAVVSCVVIWAAFAASHLTFVLQSDVSGLAAFEEPFICSYGSSSSSSLDFALSSPSSSYFSSGSTSDPSRVRTLWVTFLACAFLLPLAIVCTLSGAVLRMQRRRRAQTGNGSTAGAGAAGSSRHLAAGGGDETTQNADNDGRGRRREMTVVVMATAVTRALCWLPLQIFVLVDVFGSAGRQEMRQLETASATYRRLEMLCVCCALLGACVTAPVYRLTSSSCRDAFRLVLRRTCRRLCCCCSATTSGSGRQPQPLRGGAGLLVVGASSGGGSCGRRCVVDLDPVSSLALPVPPTPSTPSRRSPSVSVFYRQQQHPQQQPDNISDLHVHLHQPHLFQPLPSVPLQHHQHQKAASISSSASSPVSSSSHCPHHLTSPSSIAGLLLQQQQQQQKPQCRLSESDVNETILSIITDSSNHINYA
jgi:hypothetical protein